MNKKTIAIVHFNTPELTMATVLSIRKQNGGDWHVVVFDNSDRYPWPGMDGVELLDNTHGQLVNFQDILDRFPNKRRNIGCVGPCIFGSVKHMLSVEWLLGHMGPFVLADSDILMKAPIDELWDESVTAAGVLETDWSYGVDRLQPYLCFINAPECRELDIHYFDQNRTWALGTGKTERENWFDTGASFLADIRNHPKATLKKVSTSNMMVHLGGASYRTTSMIPEWLHKYRGLWNPEYQWKGTSKMIYMEHVKTFTQDGRQFHLTAEPGYLLRCKDTGNVCRVVDTLKLNRWETVEDPDATKASKPTTAKRGNRKKK